MILTKDEITLRKIALCVKTLRSEYNVTLNEFYIDTGIHLARIEQGKTNVTVFTLQKICDYFDITMSDFFSMIEEI
ncbi:helix-turn-helix transcriptional regulator [Tenacibaculum sp. 190524A02b]|uniref:Helix-turn-helix domain-containing protein n=1 Tax=Tenacibaculum vairaonense TaxID=3137860 RepID=A0ABP1F9G1_9FLAO